MLVLTRKIGEKIMIGEEIEVTILGVKGNQVRLGAEAPNDISIHREEIYQKINNALEDNDGNGAEKIK